MRRRERSDPADNPRSSGPGSVIPFSTSNHPYDEPRQPHSWSAPELSLQVSDQSPESCAASAPCERPDLPTFSPRTSSAIQDRPSPAGRSPVDEGCTGPTGHKSDQEGQSCPLPIIGNFLPDSQPVELYQPETLYRGDVLAFTGMGKPFARYEESALAALRANLDSLRGRRTQAEIGAAAGAVPNAAISVGRNIVNLTADKSGKGVKGTIGQIPTAARAYGVEPWQLWVPELHALSADERKQLQEIVRLFVEAPITRPWFSAALKTAIETTKSDQPAVASPRHSNR